MCNLVICHFRKLVNYDELTAFLSCEPTTSVVSALTTLPSRSAIQIIPLADGVISDVAIASKVTSLDPELLLICCEVTIWPCEYRTKWNSDSGKLLLAWKMTLSPTCYTIWNWFRSSAGSITENCES